MGEWVIGATIGGSIVTPARIHCLMPKPPSFLSHTFRSIRIRAQSSSFSRRLEKPGPRPYTLNNPKPQTLNPRPPKKLKPQTQGITCADLSLAAIFSHNCVGKRYQELQTCWVLLPVFQNVCFFCSRST